MPRNSRSSRSSASIVTLACSSPFHQPSACCIPSSASTPRSHAACTAGVDREPLAAHSWRSQTYSATSAQLAGRLPDRGRRCRAPPGRPPRCALGELLGGLAAARPLDEVASPGAPLPRRGCRCGTSPAARRAGSLGRHRERHRQRLLLRGEVRAHGLARDGRVAPDPEDVVDGLERESDVGAEVGERGDCSASPPASTAPSAAAHDSSAPVLAAAIRSHSSDVDGSSLSNAMSSACPAIISATASARRLAGGSRRSRRRRRAAPGGPASAGRRRRGSPGRPRTAPTPSGGAGARGRRR